MVDIIQGAFSDAVSLLKTRRTLYIVLGLLCAVAGFFLPTVPMEWAVEGTSQTQMPRLEVAYDVPAMLGGFAVFFIYPSVARTVRPEFRMTVGRFFGVIGVSLVVGIVCVLGFVAFIIPGFWIAIKWSLCIWTYLLSEGKNPFGESWEITTGQFWETFGFSLLLQLATGIPMSIALFAILMLALIVPVLGAVLLPMAFVVLVYTTNVILLGQMRWMLRLRERVGGGTMMQATA
jgi:hypothetical protein